MTQYNMTDKEQIDMLKQWWKGYGRTIAIAIVIGLVVAFGWRYWRSHTKVQVQQASDLYSQLTVADSEHKTKNAKTIASVLMKNYKSTPYASMAALWWAREAVNEKNYDQALKKSAWVYDYGHVASFRQIARIRAAEILLFQKKPKAALTMLNKVEDLDYQPLIYRVKGDIYMAMNNPEAAQKAYKSAKAGFSANDVNSPILDMKLAQ